MSARPGALLVLALAAAGCASDKLTLLENEEGAETGAVAVIDEKRGKEVLVDQPLTAAKLSGRPAPRAVKELKPKYNQLLGSLPPRSVAFIVTFPLDETRIPVDQRGVLDAIGRELAARAGAQIEVVGFTDSSGTDELNLEISRKRAEAVANELRENGFVIDPDDAVGRGEIEAKERLGDEVFDQAYRRVQVVIR